MRLALGRRHEQVGQLAPERLVTRVAEGRLYRPCGHGLESGRSDGPSFDG